MAKKVILAVHGIGDQFRYETIQSVANQVCQYCGKPPVLPLGQFFSKLYIKEASEVDAKLDKLLQSLGKAAVPTQPKPQPTALVLLEPPPPELPADFGFAEIYWADIPRAPVKDEHTLEESKKWARTIVGRVRLHYGDELKARHPNGNPAMAATVIEEMIESVAILQRLLFLAEKAGGICRNFPVKPAVSRSRSSLFRCGLVSGPRAVPSAS